MGKYKVYVSGIMYGSATVEADSEKDAIDKFWKEEPVVEIYDSEISDVTAEPFVKPKVFLKEDISEICAFKNISKTVDK